MSEPEILRTPPHAAEAEQSLLGGLLLDNQAFDRIADVVTAEDFYRDDHRRIFRHIAKLIGQGKAADVTTIAESIAASADKDRTGGPAYLGSLAQNTPSALNIHRYAELVRERALQRRLFQVASEIAESALSHGGTEVGQLLEEAEAKLLAIRDSGAHSSDPAEIGAAVAEYLDWVDEHPKGIETGLTDLDALTGGLLPGTFTVVAGRPHMGKTAIALQWAEHICASVHGLMFSLEATKREVAGRLVEWHRARAGRNASLQKVFELRFRIDDTAVLWPGLIRSKLRRVKRAHGCSIVVVDYLQLVRGSGKHDSREQEVAHVSRELKAIAKEFAVPVVALAQLNRDVERRQDKRPNMADMRESGSIEADADLILLLFRPDYYDPLAQASLAEAEIIVAKNRNNGRTGSVKVMFSRDLGRFSDYMPERYRSQVA